MRKTLGVLLVAIAAGPALAQGAQRVIPLSSPLYDAVDALYLESGMAHANMSRPWTAAEAAAALDRVDPAGLSNAGARAYEEAVRLVGWKPIFSEGAYSFRAGIEATVEAFEHVNLAQDEAASELEYEWRHGYEERAPLLDIILQAEYGESLFLETVVDAREERDAAGGALYDGDLPPAAVLSNRFNILFDDEEPWLDLYFPFKALLAAGGDWWSLRFGRDELSWGNGRSGNLMLSDWSDYYDYLGLELRSKSVKLSTVYAVLDPFDADGDTTDAKGEELSYCAFLGHRLDIRPWDRLLVSVGEAVTFATEDPVLVKDLNFLMIFHNWTEPGRMNSMITLELSANPWKYLNLYGQVAMDEFATKYEEDRTGGGGPPIFGYLAGAKADLPLGPGYLSLVGEWALTSPWLYNRRAAPYFYNVRRYWSLITDRYEYEAKALGYEYGSDALVYYAEAAYGPPGSWRLGLDLTCAAVGEKGVGAPWAPAEGDEAPSGVPERLFVAHLEAEYPFAAWLSLGADLYYCGLKNRDHVEGRYSRDLEFAARVTVRR